MSNELNIEQIDTYVVPAANDNITSQDVGVISVNDATSSIPVQTDQELAGTQYEGMDGRQFFKVDSLFAELTDEYQRYQARYHLGIAESYAMIWGNLSGNITDQLDLTTYIATAISSASNALSNTESTDYTNLNNNLSKKANIDSPNLTGTPTSVTPQSSDSSNRIATTEWVNELIKSSSETTPLYYFTVSPSYITTTTTITVIWDYSTAITSQTINGISLGIGVRTYVFNNVSSSLTITLAYIFNNKTYTKTQTISLEYPIYYGTDVNYLHDAQTLTPNFTTIINSGQYLYIFSKGYNFVSCGGIEGGFINLGNTNLNGIVYTEWRSDNPNLGIMNITLT